MAALRSLHARDVADAQRRASAAQLISVGGRDYPCVSYAEGDGTCSLYAAAPGADGLRLAADVQRCVRSRGC